MFCPNCGHQNPENTTNCQRCSAPLAAAGASAAVGKPAPKFKGTMLMSSSSPEGFGAPQGAGRPAPGAAAQFQKTMVGGISVVDPASLGGDDVDDGLDARTVMQPSQFDPQRPMGPPPPAAGAPVLSPPRAPAPPAAPPRAATPAAPMGAPPVSTGSSTMAVDASAFGLPGGAPDRSDDAMAGVASTLAVDASAFGLGGPGQPGGPGGPSPFGAAPQPPQGAPYGGGTFQPQPGTPFGGPAPQQPPQPQMQQPMGPGGGISSTVAVDISAFGLGGPGQPGGPGGAPLPGQGGPQGPYGAPNMQGGPQGFGPQQGGYPQQQQGGFPQQQQQGGFPQQQQQGGYPQQQGGFPQQQGFGQQGGMQPMPPFQSPPAAPQGGNKTVILIVVGLVVFLIAASIVAALVLRSRS